jgi:hypothetical protein
MHYSRSPFRRPTDLGFAIRMLTLACFVVGWTDRFREPILAQDAVPTSAVRQEALSNSSVEVFRQEDRLYLSVLAPGTAAKRITLPRLYATVSRWGWLGAAESKIDLIPEPDTWALEWTQTPTETNVMVMDLELSVEPLTQPPMIGATADGSIGLAAYQAKTTGQRVRYEPQPHKNTIGYWTDAEGCAVWDFQVEQPGHFAVAILQGCGAGQGGSEAEIAVSQAGTVLAPLPFEIEETGHFQNFKWRTVGQLELKSAGTYELKLAAIKIANAALVDVRAIHLVRQATAEK